MNISYQSGCRNGFAVLTLKPENQAEDYQINALVEQSNCCVAHLSLSAIPESALKP